MNSYKIISFKCPEYFSLLCFKILYYVTGWVAKNLKNDRFWSRTFLAILFCVCSCRERKCTSQEWEDIKRPSIKMAPLFSICYQCTKIVVTPSQSSCRRCHGPTVIPFLKEDFSPIRLLFPSTLSPLNASNQKDLSDLLIEYCGLFTVGSYAFWKRIYLLEIRLQSWWSKYFVPLCMKQDPGEEDISDDLFTMIVGHLHLSFLSLGKALYK